MRHFIRWLLCKAHHVKKRLLDTIVQYVEADLRAGRLETQKAKLKEHIVGLTVSNTELIAQNKDFSE